MLFRSSVNPRVPRGETAQGFYIAGADGTGYGWTQSGDPKRTLEFLRTGLQKFGEKPPKTVTIADNGEKMKYAPDAFRRILWNRIRWRFCCRRFPFRDSELPQKGARLSGHSEL